MKILAIDPGYERVGIAVVEKDNSKEILLYSDCFRTSPKELFHKRLYDVGKEIERVINKHLPEACAIEKLYFNTNQKTALMVSEVRGAVIFVALSHNLPVYEYTPLQIKSAVTGHGTSDKKQVISMVCRLISIEKDIVYDDEYDAIAIGITCMASEKGLVKP